VDVPISTSTVLATRDELFSTDEQLALAGFLAGYSGLTRDAYTLDLRQYVAWCTEGLNAVSPAARVRRPLDYESHATGLWQPSSLAPAADTSPLCQRDRSRAGNLGG
jgi:hypothetical protein